MAGAVKSVRLYGKPNKNKYEALKSLQSRYTKGVNGFISMLSKEESLWDDVLLGSSTSSAMRAYEKAHRMGDLGSALSQTAMDEAVEDARRTLVTSVMS
jgi:hypothetical protein